jgi:tetratricopeptide (TPR) repeat protein
MGNILFQRANFPAALEHFEIAHEGFPESPEILNDLGSTRLAIGDVDGAVETFRRATQVRPDFAMAWANLGGALSYKGELGTPLKAFLKATELAPHDHRIWLKMGRTLLNSGHLSTAEKCLRRVLKQKPSHQKAQATLGTLLERTHRYEEAMELLQPLIEAGLKDASAVVAWATTCRRLGRTSDAISVTEDCLETNRSQPERVLLAHTLGDLYEKNGQHAEAFAIHARANDEHNLSFNPDHYRRSVTRLIAAFGSETFESRSRASKADPTPVLIVGMPRSGTSLVEQIIDSHSQAAGAGELESLRHLSGSLGRGAGELDWQRDMDGLTPERADKLSEAYLSKLRETDASALRITDKMPINFLNLGLAAHILPGARVIHCMRDPLDTAISCYFKLFNFGYAFSTRQEWLGHFILGYQELMAHWEKVLPLQILPVRYEELVDDLEGGTRRILDFLDLPWDEGCLRFYENTRMVRTASYAQVRQPIYRSSMGRSEPYKEWLGPLIETLKGGKQGHPG